MANFADCPTSLKPIQHYLKAAQEHDARDQIISYWCRIYALQVGLKIKTNAPDDTKFLIGIMDWLENRKKELGDNESITNDVAAQAYLENYAYKLFMFADKQDRESNFGKNVVKAFYTAGLIYDVLQTFGELTDEVQQNRKYAKWKAAYINNCLKNGETPIPGPMQEENEFGAPQPPSYQTPQSPPPVQPGFGFQDPGASSSSGMDQPPEMPSLGEVAKRLPSPPTEPEKPPGGFKPYVPAEHNYYQPPVQPTGAVTLTADQLTKAQKYCKWAASALTYDDINTAVDNLQKGLRLLQTGQDN